MSTEVEQGLRGKKALVTGGTTGIGRATVELLHRAGARVALTGSNATTLAAARRELPQDVMVVRSDARSPSDASELSATLSEHFGELDVVFLNAGIALLAPFEALTEAHYTEQLDVNVKGVVFTLHRLLPLLAPGASVIVCTSVADQRGTAGMSIYSATKGAVAALVRALAVELAPRKVRVNSVSPATILTPIQQKSGSLITSPRRLQSATPSVFHSVASGRRRKSRGRCCSLRRRPRPT